MNTFAAGGILTWSPTEWGVFLGILAGGASALLAVLYPYWAKVRDDILAIKAKSVKQDERIDATATVATQAKAVGEVNTASVGNIRRDLTAVATAVPSADAIVKALAAGDANKKD